MRLEHPESRRRGLGVVAHPSDFDPKTGVLIAQQPTNPILAWLARVLNECDGSPEAMLSSAKSVRCENSRRLIEQYAGRLLSSRVA